MDLLRLQWRTGDGPYLTLPTGPALLTAGHHCPRVGASSGPVRLALGISGHQRPATWRAYRLGGWPTCRLNAVLKVLAEP